MMKKYILSASILLATTGAFAQNTTVKCGTDEHQKELMQVNPNAAEELKQFNTRLAEFMKDYKPEQYKTPGMGKAATPPKYIIPVVVHVFHNNGSENISDAQIQSEIAFLNKSFRKMNSDTGNVRPVFKDIAADAQIEFRLAKLDPQGNCTNGIVRVYNPLTARGNDELKKTSVWDTKRYYNMWVVSAINKGPGVGVAGYAQFPFFAGGAWSASTDGVMVINNEFGNIGTSQPGQTVNVTTASHESGHWLGLYHPFQGDSCDAENDGIAETPPTFFLPSVTEPLRNRCNVVNYNSCGTDNPDLPDQMENFMDYFIGPCASNMFTLQQVARMHFVLENYRDVLWSADNLVKTGVSDITPAACNPIPSFSIITSGTNINSILPGSRICQGTSVKFVDNSYNSAVTTWAWNFGDGASPATSTIKNPTNVTYNTPGSKTVTLTVTGPNGTTTKVFENALYVEAPTEALSIIDYTADWDYQNNYKQEGWYTQSETAHEFKRVSLGSFEGNACLLLQGSNFDMYNFNYALVSPSFNLTGASNPYLSFQYAFAQNTSTEAGQTATQDILAVQQSTDCGLTWTNIASPKAGNNLTTITGTVQTSVFFIPVSAAQWKPWTLTGLKKEASVKFRILFTSKAGNNLYLDNLKIGVVSGINDLTASDINLSIQPNPFSTTTTINYDLLSSNKVSVKVFDILGKEVASIVNEEQQGQGPQSVTFDRQKYNLSNGLYFVKIRIGQSEITQKVLAN